MSLPGCVLHYPGDPQEGENSFFFPYAKISSSVTNISCFISLGTRARKAVRMWEQRPLLAMMGLRLVKESLRFQSCWLLHHNLAFPDGYRRFILFLLNMSWLIIRYNYFSCYFLSPTLNCSCREGQGFCHLTIAPLRSLIHRRHYSSITALSQVNAGEVRDSSPNSSVASYYQLINSGKLKDVPGLYF